MRHSIKAWFVQKKRSGSKLAKLSYKVCDSSKEGLKLVKINLETGRHHQIRVQFSSRGFPLYGDQKYGSGPIGEQIALWAFRVAFKHPVKDEEVTFECKPKTICIWKTFENSIKEQI